MALLVLCALGLEAGWILLLQFGATPLTIVETIAFLLLASTVYLVSVFATLRISPKVDDKRLILFVLGVAVAFRLTAWSVFPLTSEDAFRYRWEGQLQAAGGNPYLATPDASEWSNLRDETYPHVGGKNIRAIYGPLLELVEHVTYRLIDGLGSFRHDARRQVFWFKLPAALADLGILATLIWWLRLRGLNPARTVAYAWCPLPVWEFWANGHNDSIMILFISLAIGSTVARRPLASFIHLALAAGTKLWPAMLIPKFWLTHERRWYVLSVLPVWALLAWPFAADVSRNAQFVSGFLGGWRNNDSLYGLVLSLAGDVYAAKYATFALLGLVVAVATFSRIRLEMSVLVMIVAMLMLSANVHPWYLTWLIPFLAFHPSPALLLWVSLAPLSYVVLIRYIALGDWQGVTDWRWFIYVPVYTLLAWELVGWWRGGRSSKEHTQQQ